MSLWMHLLLHGGHALMKLLGKGGGHSAPSAPSCGACGGGAETALKCCDRPVCRACVRSMIRSGYGGATFSCRFCSHTFTQRD